MKRFELVHIIPCDVDTFWRTFFDDEYDHAQYVDGLRFPTYEVLERDETPAQLERRARVVPRLDVPAPVGRILGPRFGYEEDGTFDREDRVWRFRYLPNALPGKLRCEGSVRVEPAGAGKCRRIVSGEVEAKVFGLGAVIEGALEKNVRMGFEATARFMSDWLARGREQAPATQPSPPPR